MKYQGSISFYDHTKGWGFIDCPALQTDIFFHHSAVPKIYRRRHDLKGQDVTFEVGERDSRPLALDLTLINPPPAINVRLSDPELNPQTTTENGAAGQEARHDN